MEDFDFSGSISRGEFIDGGAFGEVYMGVWGANKDGRDGVVSNKLPPVVVKILRNLDVFDKKVLC